MADEQQQDDSRRGSIGGGIRTTFGILSAFREAVEETFQEAVERGDIGSDRAKRVVQDAAQRVQTAFDETRERFEFVPRAEFEALRAEVAALRRRVEGVVDEEETHVLGSEHEGDTDGHGPIIVEGA